MAVQDNIMQIIPSIVEKYWDYTRNTIKPEDVSIFSNDLYYWKNSTEVVFHTSPLNIEKPLPSTSRAEKEIYYFLKCIFKDTKDRFKINGVEVDVFIPSLNLAIEYDGVYTHKNKIEKDIEKNDFLTRQKIKLIRVRDDDLPSLEDKRIIEIFCSSVNEKLLMTLLKEIKKIIRNRKITLSEETRELLKDFQISKIDMSSERVAETYILQAADPNKTSNERIVNFYNLHKSEFHVKEIWEKFLILVYSRPLMRLFDGISDENLVERFYTNQDNRGMVIDRIIDVFATNNLKLIEYKCKELIDSNAGNWFFSVIKNALSEPKRLKKEREKHNLLISLINYFKQKYPNYYLISTLNELEETIKNI